MHEAKPSAVLESRLCLKCNNSRTCTSMNGALTGLQCRILSRLKKSCPLFLQCARSPLRTPRKRTKIPSEVSQVLFKHPCVQSFAVMRQKERFLFLSAIITDHSSSIISN